MPPELLTHGGKAYVTHPWTGAVQAIPEAEAAKAIAAGLRPATDEEYKAHHLEKHYGSAKGQALSTLAGVARGATFGASDALLARNLVAAETLKNYRDVNPGWSTAGDVGGSVASFLIPGAPGARLAGIAGRAGAGAGKLATRGTAKLVARGGRIGKAAEQVPRLVEPVAREAMVGAGFGLGHAVSDIALEQLTPEQAQQRLLSGLITGAGMGAGLGVLAYGGKMAGRAIHKKFDAGIGEIRHFRAEKAKLQSEIEAVKASVPEGAPPVASISKKLEGLEQQLAKTSEGLMGAQNKLLGRVATRVVAAGVAVGLDAGVTGGVVGTLIAPRALDAVKKILGPSIEKITSVGAGKAGGVLGKATPWVTRARKAWDVIRDVPVVGEAAEAGAQAALKRAPEVIAAAGKKAAEKVPGELGETLARGVGAVKKQAEAAASGAGQAVDELTGHVLTGSGRAALQGYVGGGAGAAVAAYAGYEAKHRLLHLGDLAMNKVIPSAKVAALDRLTDADWKEAGEEIAHMDSGGLEALIRLQTPREVPDQITAAIVKQLTTAVDYLQKENPATKPTTRVPTGRDLEPTTQQKERYLRQVKAVLQPSTVLESFTRGDLHRDQVQAMEAVHPQALGQVRDIIRAEVAGRRAAGETYSRRRGNLIATMLGEPEAKPKMYDAKNVAMLQQLHAATRASQQQQTKGQPGSRAEAEATQIQRIHGGRA